MQPRSERQKILWAVFLSLLLHLVVGVSIASFGDKLQPSLPEDEKPAELTIVNLAPMPPLFSGMLTSWKIGAMSVSLLGLIAILSAVYPANRAASIDPIEALRFEAGG